ncbi:hypothetical protein [Oceaniglobus indicus]|uniref:hypothetical protein n=1 Tax=Oceaniglobus indicus TaxID=2047749 RepID=UPI000C18BA02|nr:hypothetical protein [Oceaniglobus indicus]
MKYLCGLATALIALVVGAAALNWSARPDNAPLSLDPSEALQTYLFSVSWVAGGWGMVIGVVVLVVYVSLFYALGARTYKRLAHRTP